MKKIFILITFLSFNSLLSQESILGTWYVIENDDESRQRIVLTSNALVSERLETYEVEEPYWKKDKESAIISLEKKGSGYQILGFLPEKNQYFAGEFWTDKNGELKTFQMREASANKEDALSKLDNKNSKKLLSKTYYNKKRMEEINQLPTLEKLTKEDLVVTMKAMLEYSKVLEKYVNESGEKHARFMAVKAIENLKNQKFLELGYNPFVFADPYYMDRFKEDTDVNELNEKMTLMKF
ncbi:hypothetical protein [Ekhidna sp.]